MFGFPLPFDPATTGALGRSFRAGRMVNDVLIQCNRRERIKYETQKPNKNRRSLEKCGYFGRGVENLNVIVFIRLSVPMYEAQGL